MTRLTIIGIVTDDAQGMCLQVIVGNVALYLHGSTVAARKLAADILAAADKQDGSEIDFGESLEAGIQPHSRLPNYGINKPE